ncbi:hypothetical protein B0T19DRAFT_402405 [Cercophora scortea]|uniref:Uncharacterized protein n=1 Tax=Cercophora scortea TaxID=314031 RepID=A0AAE0MA38_9PEZI|nr:hypothetical protein B0T19DRAFT_402405 [Cercophora scortea]
MNAACTASILSMNATTITMLALAQSQARARAQGQPRPRHVDRVDEVEIAMAWWAEDANIELVKEVTERNRKAQKRCSRKRFWTARLYKRPPRLLSPVPGPRPFRWLIESTHFAHGYGRTEARKNISPWVLYFRCLLVDFPTQMIDAANPAPWRGHPPSSPSEKAVACFRHGEYCINDCTCGHGHPTWGRRVVFSEHSRADPRAQVGNWLVVVYILADNRRWVEEVDVRSLRWSGKDSTKISCLRLGAPGRDGRGATSACFFERDFKLPEGVWIKSEKARQFPTDEAREKGAELGRILDGGLRRFYTGEHGSVGDKKDPEVKRALVEMLRS